jgi:hypothetical protein
MTQWQTKLTRRAKAGFRISWNDAIALCGPLCGPLRVSLAKPSDSDRSQLLDQFAAWINEGGAGREPNR